MDVNALDIRVTDNMNYDDIIILFDEYVKTQYDVEIFLNRKLCQTITFIGMV